MIDPFPFEVVYRGYRQELLDSKPVDAGSWHSVPTNGNPMLVTMEIPFTRFEIPVPRYHDLLQEDIRPNLPWAEDHFQERVCGHPLNPAPSHKYWPWAHGQHHDENEKFSHTYPERFWPKQAGESYGFKTDGEMIGIRYPYGDLMDVVKQLQANLYTRQAVLPVFFPEDTGNTANVRVPCSLTYHFMYRNNRMSCHYTMRSCDFVRHFKDDAYMAARLLQWVCEKTRTVPGELIASIDSLHAMEGDRWKMTEEIKNGEW